MSYYHDKYTFWVSLGNIFSRKCCSKALCTPSKYYHYCVSKNIVYSVSKMHFIEYEMFYIRNRIFNGPQKFVKIKKIEDPIHFVALCTIMTKYQNAAFAPHVLAFRTYDDSLNALFYNKEI